MNSDFGLEEEQLHPFKCNKKRLIDYPNLWAYTRDLYQLPGVAETVNMDHIKFHYYASHRSINPTGIVPHGPEINFFAPHERDRFGKSSQDPQSGVPDLGACRT